MRELSKEILRQCIAEPIIIFGAGRRGRFIAELVTDIGGNIIFFMDNDKQKEGKKIGSVSVISPEQFMGFNKNCWILLSIHNQEIVRQLLDLKADSDHIVDLSLYAEGKKFISFDEFCKCSFPKKEYRFLLKEDRERLCRAVSQLRIFDGLFWIRGWVIPSDIINRVTIKINGTEEVEAKSEKREDVAVQYPYQNTEMCGYFYFGETKIRENAIVEIVFWINNISVSSVVRQCEYSSSYEIFKNYFENNRYEELRKFIIEKKNIICEKKEYVAEIFRNNVKRFDSIKNKLYLYQLLYHLDIFTSMDMENYLELIETLDDIDGQAYLCEQEIPWMIFLNPGLRVERIYCWQRKMYIYLAEKIYAERRENEQKDKNKVVLLVDGLGSHIYASAIFETEIANIIQKRGYKLLIVVADTSYTRDLHICSATKRVRDSSKDKRDHMDMRTAEWDIYYCKKEEFHSRKMEIYDVINKFNPELVIDISLAGMIVSAALFKQGFRVIHIPLTDYSSGAVFNRYIAKSKKLCQIENNIYHSLDEDKIVEAPILIPYKLDSSKQYSRDELGIKKTDFVMLTVGNRLQYEMDEKFLLSIKELLSQHAQIKWIVVGNNLGNFFSECMKEYIVCKQVIEWGFEDELPALYRLCDVYINPERMGGGGSIFMAMYLAMPVAMTKKVTDITPVIGLENCRDDYADMMRYVVELMESEILRKEEGYKVKKMIERDELGMENYVNKILTAYKDIIDTEI